MSDDDHPTQALGDLMTIEENMPAGKKIEDVKLVFVGDTTQITLSALSLCVQMGMNFAQYAPKEKQIPTAVLSRAKKLLLKVELQLNYQIEMPYCKMQILSILMSGMALMRTS